MLAEIFMLRLEAQMRASEDPISSPFVPIELLAPENPDEIVEALQSSGQQRAGMA
jgi:hypothetical protein